MSVSFLKSLGFSRPVKGACKLAGNMGFTFEDSDVRTIRAVMGRPVAHDAERELTVFVADGVGIRVNDSNSTVIVCKREDTIRRLIGSVNKTKAAKWQPAEEAAPKARATTTRAKAAPAATEKQFFDRGIGVYKRAAREMGYKVQKDPTGLLIAYNDAGKIAGKYDHAKETKAGWLK